MWSCCAARWFGDASRKRFVGSGQEQGKLELVEFGLVMNVEDVAKDSRARIAQRIGLSGIDQDLLLLARLFLDELASLITAQPALRTLLKEVSHART